MRPSRFTDEQIVAALARVRNGVSAAATCRDLGITPTTFYRWRQKYEATAGDDARELRTLREENLTLKRIVADLLLEQRRTTRQVR